MCAGNTIGWVAEWEFDLLLRAVAEFRGISLDDFAELIGLFTAAELRSMYWSELAQVADLFDMKLDFRTYGPGGQA